MALTFSEYLGPSSESHTRLIQRNESEIKLLEEMRSYIEKRSKIDAEYADKIAKLQSTLRYSKSTSEDDSFLHKAWKTYVNETENKAITISQMVKELQASIPSKLDNVINCKRELLKQYKHDRSRSDLEFNCAKDEVKRLNDIYRQSLKEAAKIKEKLDQASNKGRDDKDWKKSKEKLDRSCLKLHTTHNDYVLALNVANQHQNVYNRTVLPYLLDSMQEMQEGYITEIQSVLMSIFTNTNWCKDEFIDSSKHIEGSIKLVMANIEYEQFLKKNQTSAHPNLPFFFDATLLEQDNTTSGLEQDKLALNDLTHEQLTHRKVALENQIKTIQAELKMKEEALNRSKSEAFGSEKLSNIINGNVPDNQNQLSSLEKKIQVHSFTREINELNCKEICAKVQLDLIVRKVKELGDGPPPAYITIGKPVRDIERKDRAKSLNIEPKKATQKKTGRQSMFGLKSPKKSSSDSRPSSSLTPDNEDLGDYEEPMEAVPLQCEPWFHGNIDRRGAERLLKCDGDFLVREKSDGTGAYVVSVMCRGMHKHFLLNRTETGLFKFEGDAFASVQELIHHHHNNCVPIKSADHVLIVNPVRPPFVAGDKFSYLSSDVSLGERLGNGHFGDVYRGVLTKTNVAVAIKTCREGVDEVKKKQFLEEAEIMKPYNHPNVVQLVGICRDREPFMILMELLPYGDLLKVLKKQGGNLGMRDLVRMGHDAAKGMSYLESKNTIHRDLAARNCLVGKDYVVKISDFGMSREENDEGIYTIQTTKEIPIKWTAPEVWYYQTYTSKSDVWSFGILLWEIFSLGNVPYPGWNNKRTREMVESGYRLQMPSGTPLKIYEIMKSCWAEMPDGRPNFVEIERTLAAVDH